LRLRHAVIATGLPLLTGGPRRLAHGVFSAVLRGEGLPVAPTLPEAALVRWSQAWPDRVEAIAAGLAVPPPLDLSLRDPARTDEWAERLGGLSLAHGHVRLARAGSVESIEGFAEGAWWVQDLAATVPARLLGPGEGRRVLDLCAAPGGKTCSFAAAGSKVTALGGSAAASSVCGKMSRASAWKSMSSLADAMQWRPEALFDAVLIDAPCSATGTCRRHPRCAPPPDRWRSADRIAARPPRARRRRAPCDGRLVYAVCSLEPEEGEAQAEWVKAVGRVADHGRPAARRPCSNPESWFRSDPGMLPEAGGIDGFFAAMWEKSTGPIFRPYCPRRYFLRLNFGRKTLAQFLQLGRYHRKAIGIALAFALPILLMIVLRRIPHRRAFDGRHDRLRAGGLRAGNCSFHCGALLVVRREQRQSDTACRCRCPAG